MTTGQHKTGLGEVRVVALSRISPAEGFNPRSARDPQRFAQLVASVKADGVLAPLLVTPDGDGYRLIAGEGRWLAAGEAGQTEVPVHVVEVDEQTGGLELAMAENLARSDLDPVQEARGYERLRRSGLTKKGIAQRLGVSQKRVTERLELLKLPADLHPAVANGDVPPAAIRPLIKLAGIHPGVAQCAVARVNAPSVNSWEQPLDFSDLASDPINVLTAAVEGPGCELPDGVYDASEPLLASELALDEQARQELAELCGLLDQPVEEAIVRLDRDAIEHATALGAAHATKSGWAHIIVGSDVVSELAARHIRSCLEHQRRVSERGDANGDEQTAAVGALRASADADADERERERRRGERAQAEREKAAAVAHNAQLGAAILKHLARLKLDADVLRVLTAVDVAGDIDAVAARGARYCFPGWPMETAQKNGKLKICYLDKPDAGAKAREFLAGASTVAEIAGRLFCLIAAARYADERCVARSSRCFSELKIRSGLPYSPGALDLIDELCAQRLPDALTLAVRQTRREQSETQLAHDARVAAARERLDTALADSEALSAEQREQALADVEEVHGRYSVEGHRLRKQLETSPAPVTDREVA